jgi:hypothetical protein
MHKEVLRPGDIPATFSGFCTPHHSLASLDDGTFRYKSLDGLRPAFRRFNLLPGFLLFSLFSSTGQISLNFLGGQFTEWYRRLART